MSTDKKDYKQTLNLPQTDFPMKANLPTLEPTLLEAWDKENIYHRMIEARANAPRYVFHDGPPYANGHLHLGTILNKILKDIVVKFQNMSGKRCEFVPGWDCHGLPIELEVDKKLGDKKATIDPLTKRRLCRKHAEEFIDIQRSEFKRLGVFARFEKPYMTMSYGYEAAIAREYGKFVANGGIYQGKKPISWCASCQTALAEAEVEYADRTSSSIYVKFQLLDDAELRAKWKLGSEPIYLVIWTTTPWTLPANLALAMHPEFTYAAIKVDGEVWIVAEELIEPFLKAIGKTSFGTMATFLATDLERKQCRHPFIDRTSLIITGDHVTLETGTGIVHTAPGHGQEDYEVGHRYGLPVFAPVDNAGKFTEEAGLPWLTGIFVEKSNALIIENLTQSGALVHQQNISHSYPHCWRCKRPLIFRSTEQWFISMDTHGLRKKALAAIDQVEWIPSWGKNRIGGMVEARPDWCISRQRLWGVPVVAVRCEKCGTAHTTSELVEQTAKRFDELGADAWYAEPVEAFLPPGFSCPKCGEAKRFQKEKDILDVWFDSGVSYAAVLEAEGIRGQADLYLEGSDQHRGWFHTSLLTSIGTRQRAPYKSVLTHGFVVDGAGKKYSKSAKNYVPPENLIKQHGAEILRLWVAAEDYRNDIRFSEEILTRVIESYRKIRNTCRYVLSNLYDFHPETDLVADDKLLDLDRWALGEVEEVVERCLQAYASFDFHIIYHSLNRLCTVELSAFYFDILKDRLYAEAKTGVKRRSAQTAIWRILESLTRLMAPILSFSAEELWKYLPKTSGAATSVFLTDLPKAETKYRDAHLKERWVRLMQIRGEVTKILETARAAKFIGNALQAKVVIEADAGLMEFLQSFGTELGDVFIVSEVAFGSPSGDYVLTSETIPGLKVSVLQASGQKCARCWKFATDLGVNGDHTEICGRCAKVVKGS
ncbi:MAG: isoleucine--tRNA ligase [Deltaproteobacteria bacterium]|nr:isoleucine--tRNA ligase [Deltaproteobacteria bacterium]